MEWISVADRLPEEGQKILYNYDGEIDTATRFKFMFYDFNNCTVVVTHWMELPKPPNS